MVVAGGRRVDDVQLLVSAEREIEREGYEFVRVSYGEGEESEGCVGARNEKRRENGGRWSAGFRKKDRGEMVMFWIFVWWSGGKRLDCWQFLGRRMREEGCSTAK
ncbi:hypothetical protein HAX54_016746 [Datura stramonium]|uniref:Uncharacterized protein n=1 Tax=Datura stramonium TaxID=4076 RepID=A0ABS8UK70_DATST|nr:hypothetical protein [Datura stramonium]